MAPLPVNYLFVLVQLVIIIILATIIVNRVLASCPVAPLSPSDASKVSGLNSEECSPEGNKTLQHEGFLREKLMQLGSG